MHTPGRPPAPPLRWDGIRLVHVLAKHEEECFAEPLGDVGCPVGAEAQAALGDKEQPVALVRARDLPLVSEKDNAKLG